MRLRLDTALPDDRSIGRRLWEYSVLFVVCGILMGALVGGLYVWEYHAPSFGGSSATRLCERNYANRDPSLAENDHSEFMKNCMQGQNLNQKISDCDSRSATDDDFGRCITESP
jgi:hypothetical protein